MDDFEKLGRLVGASVEAAPGQGLPRTRTEALALGAKRYFTGLPCKHGHVAERYAISGLCVECNRRHKVSPKAKERQRQYQSTPEVRERRRQLKAAPGAKERKRQYEARPEVRERKKQLRARPEAKDRLRQYSAKPERKERRRQLSARQESREYGRDRAMTKTGDAALFAINQAERAATSARAPADIVPQCPEPHRSQLQALIDRIRADPSAGKSVIGLLRTMRELRKTELVQQRATESTTAAESNT